MILPSPLLEALGWSCKGRSHVDTWFPPKSERQTLPTQQQQNPHKMVQNPLQVEQSIQMARSSSLYRFWKTHTRQWSDAQDEAFIRGTQPTITTSINQQSTNQPPRLARSLLPRNPPEQANPRQTARQNPPTHQNERWQVPSTQRIYRCLRDREDGD